MLDDNADDRPVDGDRALIRARIARLPERQRLVLFLRCYADLDYEHRPRARRLARRKARPG